MYPIKISYGPKIDYRFCKGCGTCYENCPMDVYGWDEERKMPYVAYPGECFFCCFCEINCPEVAIEVHIPIHHLLDFGIKPEAVERQKKPFGLD